MHHPIASRLRRKCPRSDLSALAISPIATGSGTEARLAGSVTLTGPSSVIGGRSAGSISPWYRSDVGWSQPQTRRVMSIQVRAFSLNMVRRGGGWRARLPLQTEKGGQHDFSGTRMEDVAQANSDKATAAPEPDAEGRWTMKLTRRVIEGYIACKYKGYLLLSGKTGSRTTSKWYGRNSRKPTGGRPPPPCSASIGSRHQPRRR